jgi:hypothetical protein
MLPSRVETPARCDRPSSRSPCSWPVKAPTYRADPDSVRQWTAVGGEAVRLNERCRSGPSADHSRDEAGNLVLYLGEQLQRWPPTSSDAAGPCPKIGNSARLLREPWSPALQPCRVGRWWRYVPARGCPPGASAAATARFTTHCSRASVLTCSNRATMYSNSYRSGYHHLGHVSVGFCTSGVADDAGAAASGQHALRRLCCVCGR